MVPSKSRRNIPSLRSLLHVASITASTALYFASNIKSINYPFADSDSIPNHCAKSVKQPFGIIDISSIPCLTQWSCKSFSCFYNKFYKWRTASWTKGICSDQKPPKLDKMILNSSNGKYLLRLCFFLKTNAHQTSFIPWVYPICGNSLDITVSKYSISSTRSPTYNGILLLISMNI